tara:strand:- start:472 stop:873 length:402 start_codon:yes stop_codon:yes gene_type:complete
MKNPMQAFVGVDFDIEYSFMSGDWKITKKGISTDNAHWYRFRPRLNKAQVLTDYTPIMVNGFVFDAVMESDSGYGDWFREHKTIEGRELYLWLYGDLERRSVLYLSFKGVEKGSEWEAWAIASDVPVIDSELP